MSSAEIPIVFVHIWKAPPPYLRDAVKQARVWNPSSPIICISSVVEDYGQGETWVDISNIPIGDAHQKFQNTTLLPGVTYDDGFWQWTTERLFVLEDWMRWKGVAECFHIENDNMLYQNISEITPLLRKVSPGLSTTCHGIAAKDGQPRACFSVLYCSSVEALGRFMFFLAAAPSSIDEMTRGGMYWEDTADDCSYLATAPMDVSLPPEREQHRHLIVDGRFTEYSLVFEAAAHGQYMGGQDPAHHKDGPGYMNPECLVRPDQYEHVWRTDELGRRYPTITDTGGKVWKIANLHIHCKRLQEFRS
jgi:hypothetical protein